MITDPTIHLENARNQLGHANRKGAIESLRQALTIDPDLPNAHGLLALCMVDEKRLHAAKHEAGLALTLEPESPFSHAVVATVALARQELSVAREHVDSALALDPTNVDSIRMKAALLLRQEKFGHVEDVLRGALEYDPEDPDIWSDMADLYVAKGEEGQADWCCRKALEIDPEHSKTLVTLGFLALNRGDIDAARDCVTIVLHQNPSDESALRLISAIKARTSIFLGVWWRFNAVMTSNGQSTMIALLLGFYLTYRIFSLVLLDIGYPQIESLMTYGWIVFCIYTWVSPSVFKRMVAREIGEVALDPHY